MLRAHNSNLCGRRALCLFGGLFCRCERRTRCRSGISVALGPADGSRSRRAGDRRQRRGKSRSHPGAGAQRRGCGSADTRAQRTADCHRPDVAVQCRTFPGAAGGGRGARCHAGRTGSRPLPDQDQVHANAGRCDLRSDRHHLLTGGPPSRLERVGNRRFRVRERSLQPAVPAFEYGKCAAALPNARFLSRRHRAIPRDL